MDLKTAQEIKEKCEIADITDNWVKMTDRHLPPNGDGTQFLTNRANDVVGLIAKAMKLGGHGGGGALTASIAYEVPNEPSKVIIVGTFPATVGQTKLDALPCNCIKVVLGKDNNGKVIFYSAYPVIAPPGAGHLGAIS